jgi:hypothetical protein
MNRISPTTKWQDVKRIIDMVALEFDCFPIYDLELAQLGRNKLYEQKNGDRDNKYSILLPTGPGIVGGEPSSDANDDDKKKNEAGASHGTLWSFNIAMSSCNGDKMEADYVKPSIYEKVFGAPHYSLKMKASHQVLSTISSSKSSGFPFSVNIFTDDIKTGTSSSDDEEKKASQGEEVKLGEEVAESPLSTSSRMGLKECFDHGLINNFRVLEIDENDFVARSRFTIFFRKDNNSIIFLGGNPIVDLENVGRLKKIENKRIIKMLSGKDASKDSKNDDEKKEKDEKD